VSAKLIELAGASGVDWEDDRAVLDLLDKSVPAVDKAVQQLAYGVVSEQLEELIAPLSAQARADLLAFLASKVK
jgi:DNA-binding FrmR family transcriptional regulator